MKLLETVTHCFLIKTWTPCKLSVKTLEVDHISTVEVGKDLRRSSGQIPLLKQGHLEVVAQHHIQKTSEHL